MSNTISRRVSAARRLCAVACLLGATSLAQAGVVTIDEPGLDRIFGHAGIDVRVRATTTIYNSDLAYMDSAEFESTVPYTYSGAIAAYFIDGFVAGPALPDGIIGLGWVGAGGFAVVSSWAADPIYSANLVGHELGHNLGLGHDDNDDMNLMFPFLTTYGFLTAEQLSIIALSSLVQTDSLGQHFIEIAPYAVMAVPEPSTYAMLLSGLGLLAYARRRKV